MEALATHFNLSSSRNYLYDHLHVLYNTTAETYEEALGKEYLRSQIVSINRLIPFISKKWVTLRDIQDIKLKINVPNEKKARFKKINEDIELLKTRVFSAIKECDQKQPLLFGGMQFFFAGVEKYYTFTQSSPTLADNYARFFQDYVNQLQPLSLPTTPAYNRILSGIGELSQEPPRKRHKGNEKDTEEKEQEVVSSTNEQNDGRRFFPLNRSPLHTSYPLENQVSGIEKEPEKEVEGLRGVLETRFDDPLTFSTPLEIKMGEITQIDRTENNAFGLLAEKDKVTSYLFSWNNKSPLRQTKNLLIYDVSAKFFYGCYQNQNTIHCENQVYNCGLSNLENLSSAKLHGTFVAAPKSMPSIVKLIDDYLLLAYPDGILYCGSLNAVSENKIPKDRYVSRDGMPIHSIESGERNMFFVGYSDGRIFCYDPDENKRRVRSNGSLSKQLTSSCTLYGGNLRVVRALRFKKPNKLFSCDSKIVIEWDLNKEKISSAYAIEEINAKGYVKKPFYKMVHDDNKLFFIGGSGRLLGFTEGEDTPIFKLNWPNRKLTSFDINGNSLVVALKNRDNESSLEFEDLRMLSENKQ